MTDAAGQTTHTLAVELFDQLLRIATVDPDMVRLAAVADPLAFLATHGMTADVYIVVETSDWTKC